MSPLSPSERAVFWSRFAASALGGHLANSDGDWNHVTPATSAAAHADELLERLDQRLEEWCREWRGNG